MYGSSSTRTAYRIASCTTKGVPESVAFAVPCHSHGKKTKEIKRWPHVKRNWLKTIQWLIDNGYINHNFNDAETGFRWWISGKPFDKFYADEFMQSKIDFDI